MTGPSHPTAKILPAGETYSRIFVPEGVSISWTVYLAPGSTRMDPFIAALSASLEADTPPSAAEAHSGNANRTLASARQKVLHCVLFEALKYCPSAFDSMTLPSVGALVLQCCRCLTCH